MLQIKAKRPPLFNPALPIFFLVKARRKGIFPSSFPSGKRVLHLRKPRLRQWSEGTILFRPFFLNLPERRGEARANWFKASTPGVGLGFWLTAKSPPPEGPRHGVRPIPLDFEANPHDPRGEGRRGLSRSGAWPRRPDLVCSAETPEPRPCGHPGN